MRIIVFISIFLTLCLSVSGQELDIKNYTEEDGLLSNQVYDIYQDVNGNLWFATDRGINRYDGYSFQSYTTIDGLPSNTVFEFFPQADGNIWCSTINNKLFYFNTSDYVFKKYQFNDVLSKNAVGGVIDDLVILENGGIVISYTNRAGVIMLSRDGVVLGSGLNDELNPDDKLMMVMENIEGTFFGYQDVEKGEVIILNDSAILARQLSVKNHHTKAVQINEYTVFKDGSQVYLKKGIQIINVISTAFTPINVGRFDDNSFWVGYRNGGIITYNFKGEPINSYLKNKSVTYVFRDHNEGLWFSTLSSGVFYATNPLIYSKTLFAKKHIYKLNTDNNNKLWISTYDGTLRSQDEAEVFQVGGGFLICPISKDDFEPELIWDGHASLGIANKRISLGLGFLFDVNNKEFQNSTNWTLPKLINYSVNDIVYSKGRYYLSTKDGLYTYNSDSEIVKKHTHPFLARAISDLAVFNENIFFATTGDGLVWLKRDEIIQLTTEDGLNSNFINKIVFENDSTILVCGNKGVNFVNVKDSELIVLDYNLLPNKNVTSLEIIADTLWVGTTNGLFYLHKSAIGVQRVENKFLRVSTILVNGNPIVYSDLLKLGYKDNNITVNFRAITFVSTDQVKYRYKIDELEEEWKYTENTSITYPGIPHGQYNMSIQANINEGTWENDQITIPFSIATPFYLTNWFRFGLVVLTCLLIYLFFKLKVITYNKYIVREFVRLIIKKLNNENGYIVLREQGKDIKIDSFEIKYIKSSGNYCEIHTDKRVYVSRMKIGEFLALIPDKLEYIQIHRSYIVRIDKIEEKSKDTISVDGVELKVSKTYLGNLKRVHF